MKIYRIIIEEREIKPIFLVVSEFEDIPKLMNKVHSNPNKIEQCELVSDNVINLWAQ